MKNQLLSRVVLLGGVMLSGIVANAQIPTESILSKLQKRNSESTPRSERIELKSGDVPVFYSQSAESDDVKLAQGLMERSAKFYEKAKHVKIKLDVYGAVLSKADWEGLPIEEEVAPGTLLTVPFGMPGLVDQGPYGAIIGTSAASDVDKDGQDDNVLSAANIYVVNKLPFANKLDFWMSFGSLENAARKMPFLTVLHEMGHVYARRLGISFAEHKSRIVEEALASFFLYEFITRDERLNRYVTLWDHTLEGYITTQCPTYKDIKTFDEIYFGVADPSTGGSILNFLYYQGMAQRLAKHLHEKYGLKFIPKLQAALKTKTINNAEDFYALLSQMDSGIAKWLQGFDKIKCD